MKATRLETPRLLLRTYSAEDRELFVALNCDSEMRRHMNGPLTRPAADKRFDKLLGGQANGQSVGWAIIEKETSAFAGHSFLVQDDRHLFLELGFLFFKSFWGRRYASETARRVVEHCLDDNGLPGLSASVDCDHAPSIRVLEKVGFKKGGEAVDEHGPYFVYTIQRPIVK